MVKLTVLVGPDTGSVFLPDGSYIVIGRSSDCDVVLHDGTVSRRHCAIESRGNAFVVSDLRSPNGVFLNDPKNRIDSHVLKNGDEIIFGRSRIRIELPVLVEVKPEPAAAEPAVGHAMALQNPSLTIEDALMAEASPGSLPSNWQDGMTVCAPRAKLVAALEQPDERLAGQSIRVENHAAPRHEEFGLLARLATGIKKFFSSWRLSQ